MKNGKLLLFTLLSTGLLMSACGAQGASSIQGDTSSQDSVSADTSSQDASSAATSSQDASSTDASIEDSSQDSSEEVLSVVGKTFVGQDIVQKDYVYYEQMKEVVEVMTTTFNEDGTYWAYSGKSQSGAMVRDQDIFMFGTYVVGEETIEATPDYGIFDGRRSDIPDEYKEANKIVYFWDTNGNLLQKTQNMNDSHEFVSLDIVMIEGEVIKEYEAPESFATYHFVEAFAEPVSGELPSAAANKIANVQALYGNSIYGLGSKGSVYLEIPTQGHVAKFVGTYTEGENKGELVIDWVEYYVDDQLLLPDVQNPIFTITPMSGGYKIPLSEETDSETGAKYNICCYYATEAE